MLFITNVYIALVCMGYRMRHTVSFRRKCFFIPRPRSKTGWLFTSPQYLTMVLGNRQSPWDHSVAYEWLDVSAWPGAHQVTELLLNTQLYLPHSTINLPHIDVKMTYYICVPVDGQRSRRCSWNPTLSTSQHYLSTPHWCNVDVKDIWSRSCAVNANDHSTCMYHIAPSV